MRSAPKAGADASAHEAAKKKTGSVRHQVAEYAFHPGNEAIAIVGKVLDPHF